MVLLGPSLVGRDRIERGQSIFAAPPPTRTTTTRLSSSGPLFILVLLGIHQWESNILV